MADAYRDQNFVPTLIASSSADGQTPIRVYANPTTHRLLVEPAGGGGFITIVAVSGTINDSNVTFTSATEPTVLVINGLVYQKTGGSITWSYLAGTITLSSPIGTGGSIFGLS